jgi:Rhodopirellula transposase DDE domain
VDEKKKELVAAFKNAGQEWHYKGQPEAVNLHDFALTRAKLSINQCLPL